MTTAKDGGKPYAPAAFTSRKCSWYSFLLEAESTPGPECDWKDFLSIKNSDDTSWDPTTDLPICSTTPQPLCHRGPQLSNLEMYFASSRKQTEDPTRTAKIHGLPKSISQASKSTNACKLQSNAARIVARVAYALREILTYVKVPQNATLTYVWE
jgi:hypothetical protein